MPGDEEPVRRRETAKKKLLTQRPRETLRYAEKRFFLRTV
jgi:hypothetical protein